MSRIWKFGSDVDTDQIVPGRFAPYMRPEADVGDAAFIEARPEFTKEAKPGDLIVALDNFGCGSSREYAAEALRRRQIGAIIANGFARIFFRNALNLGIPLFTAPEIVKELHDGEVVSFELNEGVIRTENAEYLLPELPVFARQILDAGGIVPYVKIHGRFPGES